MAAILTATSTLAPATFPKGVSQCLRRVYWSVRRPLPPHSSSRVGKAASRRPVHPRWPTGKSCRAARSSSNGARTASRFTAVARTKSPAVRCRIFAACCAKVCAASAARGTASAFASAISLAAAAAARRRRTAAASPAPAATRNAAKSCRLAAIASQSAAKTAAARTCASTIPRCAAARAKRSLSLIVKRRPELSGSGRLFCYSVLSLHSWGRSDFWGEAKGPRPCLGPRVATLTSLTQSSASPPRRRG